MTEALDDVLCPAWALIAQRVDGGGESRVFLRCNARAGHVDVHTARTLDATVTWSTDAGTPWPAWASAHDNDDEPPWGEEGTPDHGG